MIEIKNLTKTYKLNKKQMKESRTTNPIKTAVNALTLTAKKGEIYGLLGPNGAGKTTTLRCISTIIKPTKGEIYVDGHEVRKEPEKVREKIGFLTGDIKLDPQFSPDYMFDFFGKIHGVKPEKLKERKEELFTYFGIKDFAHKKMKELSTGMGQKAAIAVSLVHDPDIVIFDEPTNGLDVVTARSVTDYLKRLKEEGSQSKMFQYMASGRPICSNLKMMYCLINKYKLGIAREFDSSQEYAEAILKLLDLEPDEYNAICKRAREAAIEFDYKNLTDKLIALL